MFDLNEFQMMGISGGLIDAGGGSGHMVRTYTTGDDGSVTVTETWVSDGGGSGDSGGGDIQTVVVTGHIEPDDGGSEIQTVVVTGYTDQAGSSGFDSFIWLNPGDGLGGSSLSNPDPEPEPMPDAKADAASNGIGVKDGVNMNNLGAKIVATFSSIAAAFASAGATPVITSANDGTHMAGSQHYANQAIDLRANNISSGVAAGIVAALQASLGSDYFVQYESFPSNPSNNHIHIQTVK